MELSKLSFKITGDLHFIMPCLGLLGCGSSNPCPYCPRERRKVGGVAKWEEGEVELRTLGSLNQNYANWYEEGQRAGAEHTRKFKSVAGPILIEGVGDTFDILVLDKVPPCTLHLCLALFAKLASDEVAQRGAVVPPVETPVLVAAVHSNSGRCLQMKTKSSKARDLYIIVLQIDSQFYINLY